MMKARNNPFSAQRIDALAYRFLSGDWDALLAKLEQCGGRAAIIGSYGAGKTTMLEQLGKRLELRGQPTTFIFMNTERPWLGTGQWKELLKAVFSGRMILIDGADLMPAWQWRLVILMSRKANGLVVAGHDARGLPVLNECRTNLHLLDDLLEELTGPAEEPLKQKSRELFYQYNGDIRSVFRELYMVYADLWMDNGIKRCSV